MSTDSYIHTKLHGSPGGPTLFLFHGTGGDEKQFVSLGRQLLPDATIVSPRGDVSEYGAARFFRRTGEGVYDMDDLARAHRKDGRFRPRPSRRRQASSDDRPRLFERRQHPGVGAVSRARPCSTRSVLMHPLIPFEPEIGGDLTGKRMLITAGRRDPICPPNLTSRLEAYLRAAKADVTVDWHDGGHELRPGEIEAARRLLTPFAQRGTNGAPCRERRSARDRSWRRAARRAAISSARPMARSPR